VEVRFTLEETSNDGGLLLLNEVESQIGLIDRLSGCIKDSRHPSYVKHSISSMLRQRIMQTAAKADITDLIRDNGMIDYNHGEQI
jgi:hypothetical protein